jgi:hypothetical protein
VKRFHLKFKLMKVEREQASLPYLETPDLEFFPLIIPFMLTIARSRGSIGFRAHLKWMPMKTAR